MSTCYKSVPNVLLTECDEKHEKGETTEVTTKYGKENGSVVFNLIFEENGFYYYSIIRADGFNAQGWTKQRAERRREWAASAIQRSSEYYNEFNEDKDFLSLGEPIRAGYHNEKRHRKTIDDAWSNVGRSVQLDEKAAERESKTEYWNKGANTINLSMLENVNFYEHKLEVAKEYHAGVKSGKYPHMHSYTLTYAKEDINEAQKNYDPAVKLWGGV